MSILKAIDPYTPQKKVPLQVEKQQMGISKYRKKLGLVDEEMGKRDENDDDKSQSTDI